MAGDTKKMKITSRYTSRYGPTITGFQRASDANRQMRMSTSMMTDRSMMLLGFANQLKDSITMTASSISRLGKAMEHFNVIGKETVERWQDTNQLLTFLDAFLIPALDVWLVIKMAQSAALGLAVGSCMTGTIAVGAGFAYLRSANDEMANLFLMITLATTAATVAQVAFAIIQALVTEFYPYNIVCAIAIGAAAALLIGYALTSFRSKSEYLRVYEVEKNVQVV